MTQPPGPISWPLVVVGGLMMAVALVGLTLVRAAMGDQPELLEQGWSLALMMLALPAASISATLLFIGVALPRLRAIATEDEDSSRE